MSLSFCGPTCWGNAISDVLSDVNDLAEGAFNSTIGGLPDYATAAINEIKRNTFNAWAQWVSLNQMVGAALVDGFNAAYDGIVEIGEAAWVLMVDACRLFREYSQYINIGVQVIQGDYVNAAANLAQVATQALGLPTVARGTDSSAVQLASYVCGAIDGISSVAAIAAGVPQPPPLTPSNKLVIVDGVAMEKPKTSYELLRDRFSRVAVSANAIDSASPQKVQSVSVSVPKQSVAPKVIVGASALVAAVLLSR